VDLDAGGTVGLGALLGCQPPGAGVADVSVFDGREPPHNDEAEEGVLGAIMSPNGPSAAGLGLREIDFYRPQHRTIFEAITRLEADGVPVDAVTVAKQLLADGTLHDVGLGPHLHDLVEMVPTVSHATLYASEVLRAAQLRRLIDAGVQITQLGFETFDPAQAREIAERILVLLDLPTTATHVMLDTVEWQRLRWLWPGRLPMGKVAILDGDPDRGKSVISLDLAARTSTGTPMPGETDRRPPAGVVLVCAEDDLEDTIKPRLLAHGADMSRIASVPLQRDEHGNVKPLSIPEDLHRLEVAIRKMGAVLVVIDPITAYLSETINSHNDASVRRATTPLADLAQRTGAAILLIRHLNKSGDLKAEYRGGGSIAFSGAARSVMVVDEHPDKPGLLVLARVKMNLARGVPSLGYRLEEEPLYECPVVVWQGIEAIDARTLLAGHDARKDAPAREEACRLLEQLLADGPVDAKDAARLMDEASISNRTLKRAKQQLGVVTARKRDEHGKTIGWEWSLPRAEDAP
jgi:hypothetical protein